MARCGFCHREFKSSQSVRAHLRFCPMYKRRATTPSAPPRARRARTEEEDLRRLFGPAAPPSRPQPVSQEIEPRRTARPSTPRRDFGWSQEQIVQEVRRQWEARQADKRRQAAEQRSRAAEQRSVIQLLKLLVVDMFFTWEPIPPDARAEAKEQIERTFATLPILDLPPEERQQIATSVRERVFATFRRPPTPTLVVVPSRSDVMPTTVHSQPTEVAMPMRTVLSGYFECRLCEEEYELDRVPEPEAKCDACHVKLEEVDEEDDDAD
jgi:hypothetical protein